MQMFAFYSHFLHDFGKLLRRQVLEIQIKTVNPSILHLIIFWEFVPRRGSEKEHFPVFSGQLNEPSAGDVVMLQPTHGCVLSFPVGTGLDQPILPTELFIVRVLLFPLNTVHHHMGFRNCCYVQTLEFRVLS